MSELQKCASLPAGRARFSPAKLFCLLLINLAVFAVFVAGLEGFLYLLYRHPPTDGVRRAARSLYLNLDRRVIQYDPQCAKYDSKLSYILRSGHCTFSNREFSVSVNVNSKGLRDDEASLVKPEIIVLGDSQAMGWGVELEQSFASRIEHGLQRKVLTAAVASYGTVREMILLSQLDTSAVRVVLLAYSDGDERENYSFQQHHGHIPIMREVDYARIQKGYLQGLKWNSHPGAYLQKFWPVLFRELSKGLDRQANPSRSGERREARALLTVLGHYTPLLDGVPVVLTEIEGYNRNSPTFLGTVIRQFHKRREIGKLPGLDLRIMDLSQKLQDQHYYTLDDHMNATGHAVVAAEFLKEYGDIFR